MSRAPGERAQGRAAWVFLAPALILFLYFNDFAHWDTGVARERLLRHPLARLPPFLLGERTWEYYEVWWYLSEDAASGHQAFLSAVSRIDAIQDQAGARPLWVFAFGDSGQIHYDELLRVPHVRTIPSLHLDPEYFFNGNGHATAAGNALYADHICRSIKDDLPASPR